MSRIARRRAGRARRSRTGAALLFLSTVAGLASDPTGVSAAPPPTDVGAVTDPVLAAELRRAPGDGRVVVEVTTDDTATTVRSILHAGGVVTGSVDGELVQAVVPVANIEMLADARGVDDVRAPRAVHRPTPPPTTGAWSLSSQRSEAVAATGADRWHDAGITGAVKVGIIDFFDLGIWNVDEQGPVPDEAHRFCLDSIGVGYCPIALDGSSAGDGHEHGVAVAEVVRDLAPDAELYLATVASVADLRAAIDWFAANGVGIVTRSLGAPYDGPGDGTGPLDAVVDHATTLGITWFNSAGNEADGGYGRFTEGVTAAGYVDFAAGPEVDDTLTLEGGCIGFDGIRWANDWGKPIGLVTDYRIELSQSYLPTQVIDAGQVLGAPPLEAADHFVCPITGRLDLRIRRTATGGDRSPDVIEVALFNGRIEDGRSQAASSAAKGVADSRSPALVAVGALDPPTGSTVAPYSGQGPTTDGRITPHVVAPTCLHSTVYTPIIYGPGACFDGTSAASPVAAGIAALLLDQGLAGTGVHLASLVRHLAVDIGSPGPDPVSGAGALRLPPPPVGRAGGEIDDRPGSFVVLPSPRRLLDSRPESATGGSRGPFAPWSIVDVPVPPIDGVDEITAVAVTVTSVGSVVASYVQALPTLGGELGAFANLNVATPGQIKANAAIVPIGADRSISVYLPTGGDLVVDLMAVVTPAPLDGTGRPVTTAGRFRATDPLRVFDSRIGARPAAGSVLRIDGLPDGAGSVVLNVTATEAAGPGFLRAQPSSTTGIATANGNYEAGVDSGTLSIVPVGPDGTVEIVTSNAAHVVADLVGWFTDPAATPGSDGLFVPVRPGRAYDSRLPGGRRHESLDDRSVELVGVPADAAAVSANLAVVDADAPGWVALRADGTPLPLLSNLNHPTSAPISNATAVATAPGGRIAIFGNRSAHVIIDVNGYFTGPT